MVFRASLFSMAKSTSERLPQEAEELRSSAIRFMEHAAKLIAKSAEVEKQISLRTSHDGDRGKKH